MLYAWFAFTEAPRQPTSCGAQSSRSSSAPSSSPSSRSSVAVVPVVIAIVGVVRPSRHRDRRRRRPSRLPQREQGPQWKRGLLPGTAPPRSSASSSRSSTSSSRSSASSSRSSEISPTCAELDPVAFVTLRSSAPAAEHPASTPIVNSASKAASPTAVSLVAGGGLFHRGLLSIVSSTSSCSWSLSCHARIMPDTPEKNLRDARAGMPPTTPYRFSMCEMFLSSMEIRPSGPLVNSMKSGLRPYSAGKVISMPVSVRILWLRAHALGRRLFPRSRAQAGLPPPPPPRSGRAAASPRRRPRGPSPRARSRRTPPRSRTRTPSLWTAPWLRSRRTPPPTSLHNAR